MNKLSNRSAPTRHFNRDFKFSSWNYIFVFLSDFLRNFGAFCSSAHTPNSNVLLLTLWCPTRKKMWQWAFLYVTYW